MEIQAFLSCIHAFQQQAFKLNERRLVALVGDEHWAFSLLTHLPYFTNENASANENENENKSQPQNRTLVFGDLTLEHESVPIIKSNVSSQRFRDKLGSESDYILFADSQFTIDALAALSGTLVAGGLLFLVFNPKTQTTAFTTRFFHLLEQSPEHLIIHQKTKTNTYTDQNSADVSCNPVLIASSNNVIEKTVQHVGKELGECATSEQLNAVKAIVNVATGRRNRPLVLTADRGRGKSSALAIACAQRLITEQQKPKNQLVQRIIVTAPDSQSLSVFFKQLQQSLPSATLHQHTLTHSAGTVEFMPIDALLNLANHAKNDLPTLVLVDEAAAIPVHLLSQLLDHFHRMVFASTVHGYEGAGRGFTLKFQQHLQQKCPQWQALHIHQPIRWREHDPLERFIFQSCLLDASLPTFSAEQRQAISLPQLSCVPVSVETLLNDEKLLAQVFSVLVTAHYQTKPSDLKMLLENQSVHLLVTFSNSSHQQVVAVALLLSEGQSISDGKASLSVDENDVDAIRNSKRRLKNHFLPQSLLTHCGVEQAFHYHYFRVVRIAVHVELQQQGIGRFLLSQAEQYAQQQGGDAIGASFGASRELLTFWLSEQFKVMRIGFNQDKASGEHSALVLKAITKKTQPLVDECHQEFYRCFDYLLVEEYRALSTSLIQLIALSVPEKFLPEITAHDRANIAAFAQGQRLYSSCAYSLYVGLKQHLATLSQEHMIAVLPLVARLLQKHSCKAVCQQFHFSGKKALNQYMVHYVQHYF